MSQNHYSKFDSTSKQRSSPYTNQTVGEVYILSNPSYKDNYLKIGFTTRTAEIRSKELYDENTSVATPFVVEFSHRVVNPKKIEFEIHQRLCKHRTNRYREFFVISKVDAIKIASDVIAAYQPMNFFEAIIFKLSREINLAKARVKYFAQHRFAIVSLTAVSIALISTILIFSSNKHKSHENERLPVQKEVTKNEVSNSIDFGDIGKIPKSDLINFNQVQITQCVKNYFNQVNDQIYYYQEEAMENDYHKDIKFFADSEFGPEQDISWDLAQIEEVEKSTLAITNKRIKNLNNDFLDSEIVTLKSSLAQRIANNIVNGLIKNDAYDITDEGLNYLIQNSLESCSENSAIAAKSIDSKSQQSEVN